MIRATIDLIPADTGAPQPLAVVTITNDGTGTETSGNYDVGLFAVGMTALHVSRVEDWPRHKRSATELLHAALTALGDGA